MVASWKRSSASTYRLSTTNYCTRNGRGGATRPADILGSRRIGEILHALRDVADVIIIDTPPVLAVTDAVVLAPRVDGVVLVLRAGHTRREPAKQARAVLEKSKANIVGIVLNDAELNSTTDYYG